MWKPLTPNRVFAIRAQIDDDIHLRFGPGGFFVSILSNSPLSASPSGRVVNSVSLEEGDLAVLGRIKDKELVIMGRANECAIKIPHAVMSRHHTEIYLDEKVLFVKDLGSTNGTFFHTDNVVFDVEDYRAKHPADKASESTMDEIAEAFGPTLPDVLKRYDEFKKSKS
jgi:hypothetical protein